MTRPNELSRALRKRGCAIWPRAFGFSALERVGEPPPCDEAGAQSASGVAIGGNGLNSYAPLQEAEEITPILDRPDVLAVLETVVGAGGRVEALSGNLSDESRRFYDWRLCDRCNRVGGPGAMGGRARGSRPPRVHPRRTFAEAPE